MVYTSWKDLMFFLFLPESTHKVNYTGRNNILVVESFKDGDYYSNILNNTFVEIDKKKICFKVNSQDVIWFLSQEMAEQLENNYKINYNIKSYSKELKKLDSTALNDYNAYLFVIECIRYYENNKKRTNNDYYGIIDYDFGHKEIVGLNNISCTEHHDRETDALRMFLPKFINNTIHNPGERTRAIRYLSYIINELTRQGVASELLNKYFEAGKSDKHMEYVINKAYKYDDKNQEKFRLIDSTSDFDSYLNWELRGLKYKQFREEYQKNNRDIFRFDGKELDVEKLRNILERWIIKDKANLEERKLLDTIFKYCNGHMFLSQMIRSEVFYIYNEGQFSEFIKKMPSFKEFFKCNPLQKYKQYRVDNGLYETF